MLLPLAPSVVADRLYEAEEVVQTVLGHIPSGFSRAGCRASSALHHPDRRLFSMAKLNAQNAI
jgi:hypothetical protein